MNPRETAKDIRKIVLEQSYRAGVGHIGCCLSVADIIATLYAAEGGLLHGEPEDPDRDRFVLSCGHKALALYAALYLRGWISKGDLNSFCAEGSEIYTHPSHNVRGVGFSTGSLGMGLSFAVGAALAAKMQGSRRSVYCLLSDAELQEGSTWEAAILAGRMGLHNLVALVDCNGQQALMTMPWSSCEKVNRQFEAFGWNAYRVSGNDPQQVQKFGNDRATEKPLALCCLTTFGAGVSFMNGRGIKWHYQPLSESEYELAIAEVRDA